MTSINNNNQPFLNNYLDGNVSNTNSSVNKTSSETLFSSNVNVNYTFSPNSQTNLERIIATDNMMEEIYGQLSESELTNVRISNDPSTIKINGTEPWYQGLYEGKAFDRTVTVNRGGVKTEATYNSDGKITDVKSSDGTSIQYEYAEDGTVAKEVFTNKNGVKTTTIFSTQTLQLTEASSNQTTSATTKTTSTTTTSTKTSTAAVAADDGFGSSTSAYEIQRSKKTGKITGINFQSKQALDNYNPPATSTANAKVPIHISNKFSTTFLQYDSEGKLMGIVDYKGNLVKDMSQQEVEIKYITEEGQKILDYLQGKEIKLTEDEAKKIFDINGDGRVTINDATASQRKGQNDTALNIQRYLAEFGVNLTQSEAVKLFDTDGDGKVTEKDTYKYYVNGDPSASSQISYSQNISSYINGSRTMKLSSEAAIRMYDIDGDGKVTINDATEMQRIQQSINKGSSTSSTVNLDINGDGKIDSKDSDAAGNITTNIQRYLAEFDVTLSDSEAKKAFDLDGNGIIDEADLNQVKTGRYTIQIGKAIFITTNLNIKNEVDKIDKNSEKLARIIQHYIAKQENQFVFNSEEDLYKYFDLDMNGRIDIQDATYAQLGYPKDPPKPALTPDPDPIPEPTPEPEPEPDPNPIPEPDPEYDPERDDNPNASKHKRRK